MSGSGKETQNTIHLNECPLCGSKGLFSVMTAVDQYVSHEAFDLVQCPSCGFLMTQDVPSEQHIGAYYKAESYISHSDTKKGLMDRLYHGVRSLMLSRKEGLIHSLLGKRGRLLDIGTGTGYFPSFAKSKGWDVTATEMSADARLFAKEHFALDVQEPDALRDFPCGNFDVVTLWHVMEHLEHLDAIWKRLYEILDEGGFLVVAVPNNQSHDAWHYKSRWAAYDVPRHLWHFTPATLKSWAQKYGFHLVDMKRMPFDSFYVSMLSERQIGNKWSFISGMWEGFMSYCAALFSKGRCSSLIYVLKKSGQTNDLQ